MYNKRRQKNKKSSTILFCIIILMAIYYKKKNNNSALRKSNKELHKDKTTQRKVSGPNDIPTFCIGTKSKEFCKLISSKYQITFSYNEGVYFDTSKLIISLKKNNLLKIRGRAVNIIPLSISLVSIILDIDILTKIKKESPNTKIELYTFKDIDEYTIDYLASVETTITKINKLEPDLIMKIFTQVFEFNNLNGYNKIVNPLFISSKTL